MGTTPFRNLGRLVLSNDESGLIGIFRKAWLGREKAVFTPPLQHKLCTLAGERPMKNFVTAVDAVDDWLAVTRIFQLGQFFYDETNEGFVIGGVKHTLALF